MRRLLATVAVLAIASAACSSDDAATVDDPLVATSAPGAETSTMPPTTASGTAFAIPTSRLDAVEAAGLTFEAIEYPEQPAGVPWPTDEWPVGEPGDPEAVQAVVGRAFGELSDETGTIDAILAVQGGELVVEEYNDDWDPGEPHRSWSIAKSITQALAGVLVRDGQLDIWAPAPVPEWADPDDPRHVITTDQLLRMSSGLEWSEDYVDASGDVLSILVGEGRADRAAYAASKPAVVEPDVEWAYSTGTSNIVARVIADQVGYGSDLTGWADDELFAPLGITSTVHDLDDAGVINAGSVIDMTAQDFARFGLLYLRDGMWDGDRILPEGWVDYARMPTSTTDGPIYGASWWLDDTRTGMFYASGFDGQSITVVPDLDLVVVVLSKVPDGRDAEVVDSLIEALAV